MWKECSLWSLSLLHPIVKVIAEEEQTLFSPFILFLFVLSFHSNCVSVPPCSCYYIFALHKKNLKLKGKKT